jgi:hypothetical protein
VYILFGKKGEIEYDWIQTIECSFLHRENYCAKLIWYICSDI